MDRTPRLPKEFSLIRHVEEKAGAESSASSFFPEGLSELGREQAVLLGRVALLDISMGANVRLVTSPNAAAKETAQRAYGSPMWIDYDLRDQSRELHADEHELGETLQHVAVRALAAIARTQKYVKGSLHPVVITHGRVMSEVRIAAQYDDVSLRSLGQSSSSKNSAAIPHGTIDTYRIKQDGSAAVRTTLLGQNPHKGRFLDIPGFALD